MRRSRSSAPGLLVELGAASAETIARRMMLMGTGRCSRSEYRKMVTEKVTAAQSSALSSWFEMAFSPWSMWTAMLQPYHRAARRNARRLRRKH